MSRFIHHGKSFSIILLLLCFFHVPDLIRSQRSLDHWKRDLEHRLMMYRQQRTTIDEIIASSIAATNQPPRGAPVAGPLQMVSNGNVRFSDLIIPTGALILDRQLARPTLRIMVDKTRGYVDSKMNELLQVRNQLENIQRQLNDSRQQFIYKGTRPQPVYIPGQASQQPQQAMYQPATRITGTRVLKQLYFARTIESPRMSLEHINGSSVNRVINETYMLNPQFDLVDAQQRLFFEGRKTLWDTVFKSALKSGCCGRLKPLDTSRMMLRSANQTILAPILIHSAPSASQSGGRQSTLIRRLLTDRLFNRRLTLVNSSNSTSVQKNQVAPPPPPPRNSHNLILSTPPENMIRLASLINIHQLDQPEILKTLIFKDLVSVDELQLANSYADGRLVIGIGTAAQNAFDLDHSNYLLEFVASRNQSTAQMMQHVAGSTIVSSATHFVANLDADIVNRVANFRQFVSENLVRTDRPAQIKSTVQFNALPATFAANYTNDISARHQQTSGVLVFRCSKSLDVGLVNGMRLPQDIVILADRLQQAAAIRPGQLIHVRGPRRFSGPVAFGDFLQVEKLVNGIQMPAEVIPLHLNDFISSSGNSNLWFLDGIVAHHMTVQSSHFDDIVLRDVQADAQSLIMRAAMSVGADGSQLIRAPVRVGHLSLLPGSQLNGFRPEQILELAAGAAFESPLGGRRHFLAPVEAAECIFNDINQLTNWTNHLIRIDRPQTVQTVHRKLAFAPLNRTGRLNVGHLRVEFYPDSNPTNHANNWKFSPEFYILNQALARWNAANSTNARYRVLQQVRLFSQNQIGAARINNIALNDIVTVDQPFRFADRFVMVGKVEVKRKLRANRITSNYPLDSMDLMQFDKYRIPIGGLAASRAPIRLNSLVLGDNNRASFVHTHLLNGQPFNQFVQSLMSLTRPQTVDSQLTFGLPADFEAPVRSLSALNGIKQFNLFARDLKRAKYLFDDGLQCNSVVIKT